MKILLAIAAVGLLAVGAAAKCHDVARVNRTSVVVLQDGFVAVPFAVPVGTPSYVQYQAVSAYGGGYAAPAYGGMAPASPYKTQQAALHAQAPASTMVQQVCAKCHTGEQAKANFDISKPLTADQRLHAVSRILSQDPSKRMPKGKALTSESASALIQELSASTSQ